MNYIVRAYCFLGRQISYQGMRRDAAEPDAYGLRVSCAGTSRTTELLRGPRPLWMQPLDLRVVLSSDSPKEPPTIEPITVTLVQGGSLMSSDLGKAVCVYTHMRQRDNLSQWEPFTLEPQWIQVFGGPYGRDAVGEVLIAFEVLLWKHRDELRLQPREMWPQPEECFDRAQHFCCLRKATLHFSLQGLRDLAPLANVETLGFLSGSSHVARPMVTVGVSRFFRDDGLGEEREMTFSYEKVKPGGDEKVQADRLRTWVSKIGSSGEGSNFEFLQVGSMQVLIPDSYLLQPYVVIKAWEKPSDGMLAGTLGYAPTLIGESLQSLNPVLPCCWLDGVSLDRPYEDQKPLINEMLRVSREGGRAKEHFQQWTPEELRLRLAELKEALIRVTLKVQIIAAKGLESLSAFEKVQPYCTCEILANKVSRIRTTPVGDLSAAVWNFEGKIDNYALDDSLLFSLLDKDDVDMDRSLAKAVLPASRIHPNGFEGEIPLVLAADGKASLQVKITVLAGNKKQGSLIKVAEEDTDFLNSEALPEPLRTRRGHRRQLHLMPIDGVNVHAEEAFSPRRGVEIKALSGDGTRGLVQCKLENSTERPFVHDFWYKNMPLLRNRDIVSENDNDVDWNFQPGAVFGFVKCTFKLVDGWDAHKARADGAEATLEEEDQEDDDLVEVSDDVRLRRSFEFDSHLDAFAFDGKKLHGHFKSLARLPSRVRVRIFLVKAVVIFGKAGSFADPYLTFQLGPEKFVSMKNMVKVATNTPDIYHLEERDVQLPHEGRLEVNIMDMEDGSVTGDSLIGSTMIDLEDRWHSRRWRYYNRLQTQPLEVRALFTSEMPGKCRGSLEMWVEMIETTKASDVKPSDIRRPPDLEVEVRLVIWGTTGVPAVKDDYTNVKVSTQLDCKEYHGWSPTQETDVHFASRDGRAVFGWRMVYPNIQMPVFTCTVQFNLYHSELVMGDTFIGSFNLDLKRYLEQVSRDMMARELGPTDLKFVPADTSEYDEFNAAVNVSLYVLSQMEASNRPQGVGRSDPNDNPQLITPTEGREWGDYLSTFGFAWPDFGLWKKLIPLVISAIGFLFSVILFRQMGLM